MYRVLKCKVQFLCVESMTMNETIENARLLLEELKEILQKEGEINWLRGIVAAIGCLRNPDIKQGLVEAKSIYLTMASGKGAFSEYYIHRVDASERVEANRRLDDLRDRLWQLFQGE
jgi:hypothetical protein